MKLQALYIKLRNYELYTELYYTLLLRVLEGDVKNLDTFVTSNPKRLKGTYTHTHTHLMSMESILLQDWLLLLHIGLGRFATSLVLLHDFLSPYEQQDQVLFTTT